MYIADMKFNFIYHDRIHFVKETYRVYTKITPKFINNFLLNETNFVQILKMFC